MRRYWLGLLFVALPVTLAAQTTTDGILAISRGEYATAARILGPLAQSTENPDPVAAFFLAGLYYSGAGVRGNWTRACGLYIKASRPGSPVRLQADALLTTIDGGHPLMQAECEAASRLPWVTPPITTLAIAPGHRVLIGPDTLSVEYDGQVKASALTLGGAGVVYLPIRHTVLSGSSPQEWRRDFIEFFMWIPGKLNEPRWTLTWWVYEVVGLEVAFVPVDHLLATSDAIRPSSDTAWSARASILIGGDGRAEWRVTNAETRRGYIPQVSLP